MELRVEVCESDFDLSKEMSKLREISTTIGGIASFVGVMRSNNDQRDVEAMRLEHYPAMTEKALTQIAEEAGERWALQGVTVIHRVGLFRPGDQIVLVLTAASHRGEAFAACEFIMDFLKTKAPFWKKEVTDKGEFWVDARSSDEHAAKRWDG